MRTMRPTTQGFKLRNQHLTGTHMNGLRDRVMNLRACMSQIARYSHALTFGLLGATSILVPYVLHGSAGQSLRELGVGFGYVWTVREAVIAGSEYGVTVLILIVTNLYLLEHEGATKGITLSSALNALLMIAPTLLFMQVTPAWYDYAFISEIILSALAIGLGTYLHYTMRAQFFKTTMALRLEHARLVSSLVQMLWIFTIITTAVVFFFFMGFVNVIPEHLRYQVPALTVIAVHAVGGIYLLGIGAYLFITPVIFRLTRIEEAVEKLEAKEN